LGGNEHRKVALPPQSIYWKGKGPEGTCVSWKLITAPKEEARGNMGRFGVKGNGAFLRGASHDLISARVPRADY